MVGTALAVGDPVILNFGLLVTYVFFGKQSAAFGRGWQFSSDAITGARVTQIGWEHLRLLNVAVPKLHGKSRRNGGRHTAK